MWWPLATLIVATKTIFAIIKDTLSAWEEHWINTKRVLMVVDGHFHQRNALLNLVIQAGMGVLTAWVFNPWMGLGILAGAICGFFIDPDLDHEWKTISEGRISRMFEHTGLPMRSRLSTGVSGHMAGDCRSVGWLWC